MSEQSKLKRYDMVTNYRCGQSVEELEPADEGEWVRYEDVASELARLHAAHHMESHEYAGDPKHCHACALAAWANEWKRADMIEAAHARVQADLQDVMRQRDVARGSAMLAKGFMRQAEEGEVLADNQLRDAIASLARVQAELDELKAKLIKHMV